MLEYLPSTLRGSSFASGETSSDHLFQNLLDSPERVWFLFFNHRQPGWQDRVPFADAARNGPRIDVSGSFDLHSSETIVILRWLVGAKCSLSSLAVIQANK